MLNIGIRELFPRKTHSYELGKVNRYIDSNQIVKILN